MSVERLLVFTCDRCGARETNDLERTPSWQPASWRGVAVVSPPLAVLGDGKRYILCHGCMRAHADFLAPLAHDASEPAS